MKKFFAAAALSLAALLLFAGCSAQITADISSGWLTSPDNGYDPNFYESLDYEVSFSNTESNSASRLTIETDTENSSYNITTKAVGTMSFPTPDGSTQTYTNVYHLRSELTMSATFTYTRSNGEKLVFSFGGTHDTDPDNEEFAADDPTTIVQEVWFTSADSASTSAAEGEKARPAFSPVYSMLTNRSQAASTSVDDGNTAFVTMYEYTAEIIYDRTCENATIRYTDAFADLTAEERVVNNYVTKQSCNFEDSRELSGLQSQYTCIDGAQLSFIGRGLDMSEDASHTLTVVSGIGANFPSTEHISCRELVNSRMSFTIINADGTERVFDDEEVAIARMAFSLTGAGTNTGETTTVSYAQRASSGSNANRCLPLRLEIPYGGSVGNLVYTLDTADYRNPDSSAQA